MVSRHMETCSISLITRDIQIKTRMRYHLTLIRMTVIKKITSVNKDREIKESCLSLLVFLLSYYKIKVIYHLKKYSKIIYLSITIMEGKNQSNEGS